jgi:hypothetical protein
MTETATPGQSASGKSQGSRTTIDQNDQRLALAKSNPPGSFLVSASLDPSREGKPKRNDVEPGVIVRGAQTRRWIRDDADWCPCESA